MSTADAAPVHRTTIDDASDRAGYGPFGHGTWVIVCGCGWRTVSDRNGYNRAEIIAGDHRDHMAGYHPTRVHGCPHC